MHLLSDQPPSDKEKDKSSRVGALLVHTGGAVAVSIFSLTVLLAALIITYLADNDTMLTVLIGVVATNATSVVNYWMGSSAGSARKDALISSQLPPAAAQPNPPPASPPLVP